MYERVSTKQFVTSAFSEVSLAISMRGANAAFVEFEVFNISGDLKVQIEESNDLSNWNSVGLGEDVSSVGEASFQEGGIAAAFLCLKYVSSGSCVLSAVLKTGNL